MNFSIIPSITTSFNISIDCFISDFSSCLITYSITLCYHKPIREIEKLETGLEYNFYDEDVVKRKKNAIVMCEKYNSINPMDFELLSKTMNEILGSVG